MSEYEVHIIFPVLRRWKLGKERFRNSCSLVTELGGKEVSRDPELVENGGVLGLSRTCGGDRVLRDREEGWSGS